MYHYPYGIGNVTVHFTVFLLPKLVHHPTHEKSKFKQTKEHKEFMQLIFITHMTSRYNTL